MAGSSNAEAGRASFLDAPTRRLRVRGEDVVYRDLGTARDGVPPLVALTRLGANLDSWDPEVVDPLAAERRVLLIGYRGVGGSGGGVRRSFEEAADDLIAAVGALGLERIDLFGQSMGGMVAQAVLERAPALVDRVVLASTGPEGGPGLTRMTGVMVRTILRGALTATDPTALLFFTRTPVGRRAAVEHDARLKRRRADRDRPVPLGVLRAQLQAVKRWGGQPAPGRTFPQPALILHGDADRMVPPENTEPLRRRFDDALVIVFSDSGHGAVPQNRLAVLDAVRTFLRR
ncbi:alpha/beta fold hydrolase [Rathayibacter sp. SD072]|uniref:alpha/beta fold hydrolase n=1 Tax=Rathayibacter sp. SD072 TaxID=2781731 RepID=UPI001A97C4DD|nr:alpha/beta fold hydrolase [Rathayibacter sp. SD072]MBO0984157.1 alpha/beta fold hydrolase [Rathayibacter sp. SD072]